MEKKSNRIVKFLCRCLCTALVTFVAVADTYQLGDLAPRGAPDGQLNAADAVLLQRMVMGVIEADDKERLIADVAPKDNPDGILNAGDLVVQQRAILGLTTLGTVSNTVPVITSVPILTIAPNTLYNYLVLANDADGDVLTFSLTQSPVGMSIDEASGLITWNTAAPNSYPVSVEVNDGRGGVVAQAYTLTVEGAVNSPPVITSTPNSNTVIDVPYTYQIMANDPDGDTVSYRLITAPLGMNMTATGLIKWMPVVNGVNTVALEVSDDNGGTAMQNYAITVTGAVAHTPILSPINNQTANLGTTLSFQLTASSPDNSSLMYLAEPMPLPANMSLNSNNGMFTFIPAENQVGIFTLTFIVSNGRFRSQQTITITVPNPSGVTRLIGKVLTFNDAPLPGLRLEIGGVETVTDANGDYFLDNIPVSGDARLLVDGSTVDPALGFFAVIPEIVNIVAGTDNYLTPPVYLLPMDMFSADMVDSTTTSVVTSSRFTNNLEISEPVTTTIDPGSAIEDTTAQVFNGNINISRIADPDLVPRPLPEDMDFSVFISIQPFGVTYPQPIPISFPNLEHFPPGTRLDFFALNHDTGKMEKIGEGLVSADGKTVDSIGGVVKANSWHAIVPQPPIIIADNDVNQTDPESDLNDDCAACAINKETGNLKEWHKLPTYYSLERARQIKFEYNSNTANPKPIIPITLSLGNASPIPSVSSTRITVGGIELGREIFNEVNVVPSQTPGRAKTTRMSVQFDGSDMQTGLYNYDLVLNNYFPSSRRSQTLSGQVIVQNQTQSAFGAGWTIAGLQQVFEINSGAVLLTEGTATSLIFTPVDATQFTSPAGDFSSLTRLLDGSLERTMKDGTRYRFDLDGLMIEEIDRNDNVTSYQYNASNQLIQITDPVGESFVLTYFNGKLDSVTDPLNRQTRFEHDSEGNLTAIIEPNADRREFEYQQGSNLMTAQTDQRGNRSQYLYNFADRIQQAILPDNSSIQYDVAIVKGLPDYAPLGMPGDGTRESPVPAPPLREDINNTQFDANGNKTMVESDGRTIPTKITDALNRVVLFNRDADSNPLDTTRPNGSVIQRTFDNKGNVKTSHELFNDAVTTITYDNFSLPTTVTNPNNHTTTFVRNALNGNVESIINHLTHTTTIEYEPRGLVQRVVTPNQLESVYTYNALGLVETITETPLVASPGNIRLTQYSYDAAGQLIQTITPDGITLTLDYDSKGRLKKVTDNLSQIINYTYDEFDNLIQTDTKNSDGSLALMLKQTYDTRNRLEEIHAPHIGIVESITKRTYDNNSNVLDINDPNGNSALYAYDEEDRLIENTHRLNGITQYEYDTNNRVTKVTAPNGVITEYTYDVLGRRLTETSADRGTVQYSYDKSNNLRTVTDGRSIQTTLAYDELERVSTKTYPNTLSEKIENVVYTYDNCTLGLGLLCNRTDENGNWAYEYDIFGNTVSVIRTELGIPYITQYQYDDGDNIIQTRYPSGRIVDYARDGIRRMQSISTKINNIPTNMVSNIQYRADNKMTQCTFGNGLVDTRGYDLQGRLLNQSLGAIDNRTYTYDKNSNILNRQTTPQASLYSYDELNRIIGDQIDAADTIQYQYDLNHNRQQKSQLINLTDDYDYVFGSNQINHQSQSSSDTLTVASLDQQFIYNNANRLYQLIENGQLKAQYLYNANGERTRKTIFNPDATQTITLYHYDLMGYLISETSDTGAPKRDYIWADNMTPVAQIDISGTTDTLSYLHTDHLMTPRLATDASQQITWRWEGEAFGETKPVIETTTVNLRFPGQYSDSESGLYYNMFRSYDPAVGRYMTSDPIGLLGGLNTYGYVGGNPLSMFDLLGLDNNSNILMRQRFNELFYPNSSIQPKITGEFDTKKYRNIQRQIQLKEERKRHNEKVDSCLEGVFWDTAESTLKGEVTSELMTKSGLKFVGKKLVPLYGQITGLQSISDALQCIVCTE